ncbi:MAG: hypothetical protein JNK78_15030 [Planctomycetes bacterium]|nr:hypothetical protein [Planctomycetota bacterium]
MQDPTGTCGWKPWCDDVRVVDIDCKHLDLFHEPHLSTLAQRLDEALNSPSAQPEPGPNGPASRP